MMCVLHCMKVYSWTELHWISSNFAVSEIAFAETEALLPYDCHVRADCSRYRLD